MIDPYRMVVVNLVLSLFLIAFFLILKIKFPKKRLSPTLIIFITSLLPLVSLLRKGTYESGDLSLHATRFLSFYESLRSGILVPRWSHDLNSGFGYPLFIFVQTLPNYIASLFHFFGFSMIDSIKILFGISFIISGIAMYYFLRERFGERESLAGALLYLFAPYHLVNMHFRANPGEVISSAILPMCGLLIEKINKNRSITKISLLGISIGILILAHPIALILIPFLFLYTLFLFSRNYDYKFISSIMFAFVIGLLLSAFYWAPVLLESRFTHQKLYNSEIIFTQVTELIYSPWRFGFLFQGHHGELSFLLGYVQILLVLSSFFLLFKKGQDRKKKTYLRFFLVSFLFFVFIMTSISKPIWDFFEILHGLQFSYRILILQTFIVSILCTLAITRMKSNKLLFILISFAVFGTMLNWGNRRTIPDIDDQYLFQNKDSLSLIEKNTPSTPIWLNPKDPWQKNPRTSDLKVDKKTVNYQTVQRTPVKHVYQITAVKKTKIVENTVYFPGWAVFINDRRTEIIPERDSGLITFSIPKGQHKVEVLFQETKERKFARNLSILGIIVVFSSFSMHFLRKKRRIN